MLTPCNAVDAKVFYKEVCPGYVLRGTAIAFCAMQPVRERVDFGNTRHAAGSNETLACLKLLPKKGLCEGNKLYAFIQLQNLITDQPYALQDYDITSPIISTGQTLSSDVTQNRKCVEAEVSSLF